MGLQVIWRRLKCRAPTQAIEPHSHKFLLSICARNHAASTSRRGKLSLPMQAGAVPVLFSLSGRVGSRPSGPRCTPSQMGWRQLSWCLPWPPKCLAAGCMGKLGMGMGSLDIVARQPVESPWAAWLAQHDYRRWLAWALGCAPVRAAWRPGLHWRDGVIPVGSTAGGCAPKSPNWTIVARGYADCRHPKERLPVGRFEL